MELGRYADTVLAAYGVTLGLIALLVLASWERAVRVRKRLTELESRRKTDG